MIPEEVKRIIEVVEIDRKKRVGDIRNANRLEVRNILREGKEECKALRERILDEYEKRAEVSKRKWSADIEIKKREELKAVKSDMVRALKEDVLRSFREGDYRGFLRGFLERGIREVGRTELEVFVGKNDVEDAKMFLKGFGVKGDVKTLKTLGGCMIKSGKMTSNYLIESIMDRKEREMDKIINEVFLKG